MSAVTVHLRGAMSVVYSNRAVSLVMHRNLLNMTVQVVDVEERRPVRWLRAFVDFRTRLRSYL